MFDLELVEKYLELPLGELEEIRKDRYPRNKYDQVLLAIKNAVAREHYAAVRRYNLAVDYVMEHKEELL